MHNYAQRGYRGVFLSAANSALELSTSAAVWLEWKETGSRILIHWALECLGIKEILGHYLFELYMRVAL